MNTPGAAPAPMPESADTVAARVAACEQRVAQLQQQLDTARGELQDFVYTVSHDLRAPLRHINAFAQIIAEDLVDIPPDIAGHLLTIRQSAQLLTQQLEGLSALSRLSHASVLVTAVDTVSLMQDVMQGLLPHQTTRQLQWQVAPDLPAVRADAKLLRQVFEQVIGNAIKFTRPRAQAEVAVSWQSVADGRCLISVQDNGVGFNPQQADRLFKVFGKLHSVREFEGLGLGLLQCRKMLACMDASIAISAQADAGCVVTLTLPLAL
jgi:light-regulated signal transduction histidine kinase (bacteriophytochrome)